MLYTPIERKILNLQGSSSKNVMDNKIINDIIEILGTTKDKVYNSTDEFRYGM
ncbi:DNA topoisomerase-like protein, putative [Medicago truncatula]|uniref:DNA topoisomerase-like protein, putative n=1 Tax=Medicago truncatula TaxID=3880 RepID=G7I6R3_MEDTR|nr:DNA topoisomerase-like protein, putative [Medicago truncatula]